MANEFKIKKGLIVTGASGGTVVDIQGSQGQLFSVTDDLSGSIFAVSDISGVPILDVNSSGLSTFSDNVVIGSVDSVVTGLNIGEASPTIQLFDTTNDGKLLMYMQDSTAVIGTYSNHSLKLFSDSTLALTIDTSQNATFEGDITVSGGDITVSNAITGISGGSFRVKNNGGTTIATFADDLSATFAAQAFSTATSSGDASSTLTTKGYVDSLITGATIYRGAWQAGISATSSAATTASTTLTVTAAILDADGNTPDLVGAVVTGEGITGIVKVASVTSSTVYVLDTAITATATAYIFSPIYGAPDLSGVTETSGYYYICSEAGSATPNGANSEPNTWNVGDWCIYNDVSGTGQWQKIDNSSVLSGVGTGQTVALWEGPSSVTDSDTLGNAPITVSGNNTTFAGTVEAATYYKSSGTSAVLGTDTSGEVLLRPTSSISSTAQSSFTTTLATIGTDATFAGTVSTGGYLTLNSVDNIPRLIFNGSGDDFFLSNTATYFGLYNDTDSRWDIKVDGSGNTTFAGNVTAADLLTVNGDGHLFLGADGETPKIDMMYVDSTSGLGWDTRIFTGKTDDLPNGQSFPTSTIAGGFGTQYQANSDGAFFGIIPYATGNYRPIINWGDDVSDTPFSFQFNGSDIVTINYVGDITAPIFSGDHQGTINTATTGVTQTAGNNSTLIATTAYADAAAAAVDPSGVYLPLAGGTMDASANINMNSGTLSSVNSIDFGIGQLNGVSTSNLILKSLGDITYNVDSNNNGNSSHIFQESGSELMRIRYDGNVGIGTTSPVATLQVGSITTTAMSQVVGKARIVGTNYIPSSTQMGTLDIASTTRNSSAPFNQGFGPSITFSQNISGYVDGYEVVIGAIKSIVTSGSNTGQESAMTFLVNGGTSTGVVERMRIAEDGNVGIGVTNPEYKLDVGGAVYSSSTIGNITAGSLGQQMELGNASQTTLRFDANRWRLYAGASAGEVFTVEETGNVGINNTGPDYKLEVNGTFGVSDLPGNGSSTSVLVQDQTTTPLTVPNGDFATDTVWVKGTGWTISGGKANVSGAQTGTTYIYQGGILPNPPENIEYIIKYTVSNYSAGEFRINVGGYISSSPAQTANGTYEVKVTPTHSSSNTNIYIQANAAAIGSIDRISVNQVTAGTNQIKTRELGGGVFDDTWAVTPTDSDNIYNLNSGNVGIGTSTPNAKLDIQGTQGQLFSVTDDLSGSIFAVSDISGVPIFDVNSSGVSYFDGSLGIGTDNPDVKLWVNDTADGDKIRWGKDNVLVGSIGTYNGVPYIGYQGGAGGGIMFNGASIEPTLLGNSRSSNTNDIGSTTYRWKDGWFAGQVTAGPNITATGGTGNSALTLQADTGNWVFTNVRASRNLEISDSDGTGTVMTINTNGNVGIGTTNPGTVHGVSYGTTKLHIDGGTDRGQAVIEGNVTASLVFSNNGGTVNEKVFSTFVDNGSYNIKPLNDNGTSTAQGPAVTVLHGGNVGIGVTGPASKLNVASTGTNPYSATLDSASNMKGIRNVLTSNGDDMVGIYFATGTVTTGTHWSGITGSRSANASHWGTQLNFYTHNNDVANLNHATQKMVIKGDGNVGIGVTGPLVKLHVNQGNTSGTVIKASGIQAQIEIQTSTAGDAHLYMRPNTTGNNAAIFKMTAGTNYNWRWQDDATTPVVFMQLSQSNSSLSVKGDIIAYGSPSDERYKENIKPIESALDKVTKLQGVTFNWKESDSILDIKEDIGFIAQDVQKVVPELVRENEDGKLSLRYQGITPILLEAIKELKAEIEELKKQIK